VPQGTSTCSDTAVYMTRISIRAARGLVWMLWAVLVLRTCSSPESSNEVGKQVPRGGDNEEDEKLGVVLCAMEVDLERVRVLLDTLLGSVPGGRAEVFLSTDNPDAGWAGLSSQLVGSLHARRVSDVGDRANR